jgi:hypothetical protein
MADPLDSVDGLTSLADVSKTEFVTEMKAVPRWFADANAVRSYDLSGRTRIMVGNESYRLDTESTAADDGDEVIIDDGGNHWLKITAAFTGLTDAPSSYSGQGRKSLVVKDDETGLEFRTVVVFNESDVTLTVGSGGDYSTINAALEAASRMYPIYKALGVLVEIRLLTGFVMAEQVLVKGVDLSFVTITSVDSEVSITRSALTSTIDTQSRYPAFGAFQGGFLPVISALFNMDTSGVATGRDGVYCSEGSQAIIREGFGIKNAGGDGVSAQRNSRIVAHQSVFSGAGENCCHAGRLSSIDASQANFSYAGQAGIYCWRNSDVNCYSLTNCSHAGTYGVYAFTGGRIQGQFDATYAVIHGIYALNGGYVAALSSDGSNAGTDGIRAQAASIVSAPAFKANGCGNAGINSLYGSNVSAQNCDVSGNTTFGVRALAGNIDIVGGNAQIGGSTSTSDISVAQGGIIRAANATGGVNQTVNTLAAAGIIFR